MAAPHADQRSARQPPRWLVPGVARRSPAEFACAAQRQCRRFLRKPLGCPLCGADDVAAGHVTVARVGVGFLAAVQACRQVVSRLSAPEPRRTNCRTVWRMPAGQIERRSCSRDQLATNLYLTPLFEGTSQEARVQFFTPPLFGRKSFWSAKPRLPQDSAPGGSLSQRHRSSRRWATSLRGS